VNFLSVRPLALAIALAGAWPLAAMANSNSSSPDAGPPAVDATPNVPTDLDHVLVPLDLLRVQVFQEEDINRQCERIEVSQDLTVTLPLIGVLSVKGKTIGQLSEAIRSGYDKDFLVNPQVSVQVLKYAERFVNVIGSVTSQGKIQFPDVRGLSVVDAIALAGGKTRLADLKHVKITRRNADGESEVSELDVGAMMKENGGQSVMLQPGDIVYVPERML